MQYFIVVLMGGIMIKIIYISFHWGPFKGPLRVVGPHFESHYFREETVIIL